MRHKLKFNSCQIIFQGYDAVHLALWTQEPAKQRGKKFVSDLTGVLDGYQVKITVFCRILSWENETTFISWKAVAKGWKCLNLWKFACRFVSFMKATSSEFSIFSLCQYMILISALADISTRSPMAEHGVHPGFLNHWSW